MVGQEELLKRFETLVSEDKFPRFSIIVGEKGSGKKMIAHKLFAMFGSGVVTVYDTSINSVREMISQSYKLNGVLSVNIIPDADTMSMQAKNALLKVTEEPPRGAYFIMTLEDERNTLETILSRGTVFRVEKYTPAQIAQYCEEQFVVSEEELQLYKDICNTPGEANMLQQTGIDDFYKYVVLTVDNINKVSLANALKISSRISMKSDDTENYDLKMFWKVFIRVCNQRMQEDDMYVDWIRITSKSLKRLSVKGANKQMLFDNWIFEIREWR